MMAAAAQAASGQQLEALWYSTPSEGSVRSFLTHADQISITGWRGDTARRLDAERHRHRSRDVGRRCEEGRDAAAFVRLNELLAGNEPGQSVINIAVGEPQRAVFDYHAGIVTRRSMSPLSRATVPTEELGGAARRPRRT